jgi:peptide subunit release factor 1 (eRF1)
MPLAATAGMPKTSPASATPLRDRLELLAAFEPQDLPVISLYLNLAPDQHGRDNYETFLRKAFDDRLKGFRPNSAERESFSNDVQRIDAYLTDAVNRSSNSLALFACSGADFFEAVQLDVPIDDHWLFVGQVPHLYPLARLVDQYPRYASVVLDTNRARIFVFSLGSVEQRQEVTGVKTRRNSMGGWSQARYQRRAENFHLLHVKEVVDVLDRIVREDRIDRIVVAGDDVVVPLLKEQLPQHLMEKLVDVLRLERDAAEDEIVDATLEVLRQKDSEEDADRVAEMIGAWQSNGLGAVGPEAVLRALELGQVDELLITANPGSLKPVQKLPDDSRTGDVAVETSAPGGGDERRFKVADELVARAQQTSARVRMIEDPSLLEDFGGVGALLRFRI